MDQIKLSHQPEDTGIFVADVEAAAMRKAYLRRNAENVGLFVEQHTTKTPEQLGAFVADIQDAARRKAFKGFLWRFALIGGGGSLALLVLAIDFIAVVALFLVSIPISIGLSLRS